MCMGLPFYSFSQLSEVNVTVIDGESNEPLIGANIYSDDFKIVATTDYDGKATLVGINNRDEINFTYIGYYPARLAMYEIRKRNNVIALFTNNNELDSVVIIGRRDDLESEIPFKINRITKAEIAFHNSQTPADALAQNSDVFIQKSQMGGGSPVIRGFEANKVLLVVDGVRMNNAIYRNGHHQNAITVDNSVIEQIEVIHGPGSLTYGSDALGGVIHFRTRDPKILLEENLDKPYEIKTNAYTRFATANMEKTFHFDVDYGSRKIGSLTSFTFSDYDDLRAGSKRPAEFPTFGERNFYAQRDGQDFISKSNNPNIQNQTGYSQIDFLQKLKYQINDGLAAVLNLQFSTSSDVPRYDQLTEFVDQEDDLKFTEWYYGPQKRVMASLKVRSLNPNIIYDKASFIAAFQNIDEDRFSRKFANIMRTFNKEDLQVYSFTADFDKFLDEDENNLFTYGVEFNYNNLKSKAGRIHLRDEFVLYDVLTRYPSGGSTMDALAGFANYRWRSSNRIFTANAGMRFTNTGLSVKYLESDPIQWGQEYYDGIKSRNSALTWGAGLTINTPSKWQVRLSSASAFRAPNIDDFAKIRKKSGFVTIPNPTLGPERSISSEITIAKEFGEVGKEGSGSSLKLSTTGFYTFLNGAITRQGYCATDSCTIVSDDEVLYTQANVNSENSYVYGVSANALVNIANKWFINGSYNYTFGRSDIDTDNYGLQTVPMSHIPPAYGRIGLRYQKSKFKVEGKIIFNLAKKLSEYAVSRFISGEDGEPILDRLGTSDNLDYSPIAVDQYGNEYFTGSYGWTTFNIYSSYRLNETFSLDMAVENIGDFHYRPFSSGVSAPGRNFIISLKGRF